MSNSEAPQVNFIDNFCVIALQHLREKQKLKKNMFELAQLLEKQVFTSNSIFSDDEERIREMWLFDIIQIHEKEKFLDQLKHEGQEFEKVLQSTLRQSKKLAEEFECPVCLNEMKPPVRIYQCVSGHPVCDFCYGYFGDHTSCPTCRMSMVGRSTLVEKLANQFFTNPS